MLQKALVGKKQEIYLPRGVRQSMGIKPGDKLVANVTREGEVLLKRIPSPVELLAKKPQGKITVEEDLSLRRKLSRSLET